MKFKPTVTIYRSTLAQLQSYVKHCDIELGGLGMVEVDSKTNTYHIGEVYLVNQEAGSAHTDLDANDIAKLMYETKDDVGNLSFWWHSHVNMNTFWSGTDEATIKEYSANGMCIAMVLNKKNEYRCAVGEKTLSGNVIIIDEIPVTILEDLIDEDAIKAEIKEKVKTRRWATTSATEAWRDRSPWYNPYWDNEQEGAKKVTETTPSNGIVQPELPLNKQESLLRTNSKEISTTSETWFQRQCPEWDNLPQSIKKQYDYDIVEYYWSRHHA